MPNNVVQLTDSSQVQSARSALDEILRQGAQKLLGAAIQNEVDEYIQTHAAVRDEKGHRLVVRNGYLPERQIQTPLGEVSIRQARVNDRRPEQKFLSKLLPPYLRRTPSLEALIPALYLRGFWAALEEEYPGVTRQRCWVHKTANVLDKLPKSVQAAPDTT